MSHIDIDGADLRSKKGTTTPSVITIFITGFNRRLCCRLLLLSSYLQRLSNNRHSRRPQPSLPHLSISFILRLPIVKIGPNVRADLAAAVQELEEKHGIDTIDVVIANASTGYVWPKVREAQVDDNNRRRICLGLWS
ncbi:hypothetical protein NEUTE1DRAFT_142190 [Neurospora tetrasperma FGSC 2508]|uniref:Uncharacterized protein n=1 Tax=Neurospora tetrasperma (strain FGSC 2508 / ATCC MYA-4615 / P0657) TaxID=510951 RepID=F8N1A6_NEUT8|nr:uncharacterized protein NEUTE1DRAFT_142190 [Neurospora tetrasperma FGSC 2508]EGO52290.1 hypothetical protein NEUTE1DRAFT_142190 [Neurospora tetrasperma FGSC 2508]